MSDIVGTPPAGWIPVTIIAYNDVLTGTYVGLEAPAGFCYIMTDLDVYTVEAAVPDDGWLIGLSSVYDPTLQLIFYSHVSSSGSAHWSGFQKVKAGSYIMARYSSSLASLGSILASGYLVQDYTSGEAY